MPSTEGGLDKNIDSIITSDSNQLQSDTTQCLVPFLETWGTGTHELDSGTKENTETSGDFVHRQKHITEGKLNGTEIRVSKGRPLSIQMGWDSPDGNHCKFQLCPPPSCRQAHETDERYVFL
jgi:hypothetical protein